MILRVATLLIWSVLVMPVFAEPSKTDSEMGALRTYCKPDVERLCPKVAPGGGRIKACLMEHKNEMSVGCARALQGLKHGH
jgi:cysteine rich repeat protein